ncbi:hypothetical protein PISMIDRAFT_250886 [Pisolithus microcarpus 441]|uniref:Uncharacterized protein n=1 Tax=Pisolithus microcarpus 441 TaxID=765257 RepID=A0A0C9ZA18_9AGAM|nr:hypothetical protein PISMIDRAFT_250886 [Pisolithus microcarpus 441]
MDQKCKRAGRYVDLRTCMHDVQYPHVSVVVVAVCKRMMTTVAHLHSCLHSFIVHAHSNSLHFVPFSYRITMKYIRST